MAALLDRFASRLRSAWWSAHGAEIGPACRLGRGVRLARGFRDGRNGRVVLGRGSELQVGAILDAWGGSIEVAEGVFIGPYAVIYGHGGVTIGDHALVSMHCRILSSNHGVPEPGKNIRFEPDELLPTRVGRDVWLGAGVTVLGGVAIGDGCVVGAGSVVTENLPANVVAAGIPARIIGPRTGRAPK
jgi:acetyltransferase-like isoleucine patch superfamily enzyme